MLGIIGILGFAYGVGSRKALKGLLEMIVKKLRIDIESGTGCLK